MQLRFIPILLLLSQFAFAQSEGTFNASLVAQLNDRGTGPRSYNDIWGYESADGHEYAVLGGRNGTIIIDLATPSQPKEVAYVPGTNSIWRDMKSFGDFIYVVADRGQDGLLIINMENAPDSITWEFWKPTLTIGVTTNTLQKCHNLYIDENGVCYLAGSNLNGGGVLMFDVASTPEQPTFLGAATNRYSHDVYARGDTLYSADLNNGFFSITDVSNKQNPKFLAFQQTTRNFTHNVWLSDDGKYLFTTDERSNAYVDAYDISDLGNIRLLDSYRPLATEGLGVLPHNVHYFNGYLVISYYADGIKIVDASRPWNLIEVAAYDTSPNTGSGDGCWGAFPFIESGYVLASDMEEGLFVLDVDYKRACYLEGTVRDEMTGVALPEVDVSIVADQKNFNSTGPDGTFQTGIVDQGNFLVRFSKEGYEPKEVTVDLANGVLTSLDIELTPIQKINFSGQITHQFTQIGVPGKIRVEGENGTFVFGANSSGDFSFEDVPQGFYDIYIGSWGFRPKFLTNFDLTSSRELNIELEPGYQDDFSVDQGWTVSGDATTGQWVREVPIGVSYGGGFTNPDQDAPDADLGLCYLTGNGEGDPGLYDVDDGTVLLTSPPMDLLAYENPNLSFYYWFYNGAGVGAPDDTLRFYIDNGQEKVLLGEIAENPGDWVNLDFDIIDYIALSDSMVFSVETADKGNPHLLEAGIDGFFVIDHILVDNERLLEEKVDLTVFPNPFSSELSVRFSLSQKRESVLLRVLNSMGQPIREWRVSAQDTELSFGSDWPSGIYFLVWEGTDRERIVKKVIKK